MKHPNALHPDRMDAAERLDEIAAILAAGVIRLKGRQSTRLSAHSEKSFVDFSAHQSRHGTALMEAENDQ